MGMGGLVTAKGRALPVCAHYTMPHFVPPGGGRESRRRIRSHEGEGPAAVPDVPAGGPDLEPAQEGAPKLRLMWRRERWRKELDRPQ